MNERLATYLNDHLGGATAGVELARRLEQAVRGHPDGASLDGLADEIAEDLATLRSAVDAIGGSTNPIKQAVGWVAEKAHRVGVAVDAAAGDGESGDNDLARLLDAESLSIGVEGKLCMWVALLEVAGAYPGLAALDLPGLADRARDQRRRIEVVRLAAARRAFAPVGQVAG
jgi:hypothetical protein